MWDSYLQMANADVLAMIRKSLSVVTYCVLYLTKTFRCYTLINFKNTFFRCLKLGNPNLDNLAQLMRQVDVLHK